VLTNEVINEISEPVDDTDDLGMLEMLLLENIGSGVGIAAVQIGLLKRVIVITVNGKLLTICNPEIVRTSKEKKISKEGCLSYPGKFVKVQRYYRITIKGLSVKREPIELNLSSHAAYIAQHEIDHLNGIHI